MSVTIGSVPYLNARPLVDWFYRTDAGRASGVRVVEDTPSRLAGPLESGELACALLSSIEWVRRPEFGYVDGLCIASRGPVESVRVFCRVPRERVRSVALDTSSLTSVALVRLLSARLFPAGATLVSAPPDAEAMLSSCDAALLIGDLGFRDWPGVVQTIDLGTEWTAWTGLPFVWALWVGRPEFLTPELSDDLHRALTWGEANRELLAGCTASSHQTTPARALHYLRDVMRFRLEDVERAGLVRFAAEVRAAGLVS